MTALVCQICMYLHVSLTYNRAHPERKQIDLILPKRIQCDVIEVDVIGMNIDK